MQRTIVLSECLTRQVPCDGATSTRDVRVSVTDATFSLVTRVWTLVMLICNSAWKSWPSLSPCPLFTARKRSSRRLCFYTCLSVHRGRGSTWTGTPRTRYTPPGPGTNPLPDQVLTPPDQVHPLWTRYTPLDQVPPQSSACWEIRATSGRYASYWNAFLLSRQCRLQSNAPFYAILPVFYIEMLRNQKFLFLILQHDSSSELLYKSNLRNK